MKTMNKINLLILILVMALLSINGIAGGVLLMAKPDGSLIGMKIEWLSRTPFQNFLIPGILLFLLNGLFPLVSLAGLITKKGSRLFDRLNIYSDKHWSWTFTVYSGIITISWIIIQQLITEYFFLQPVIAAAGLINLVLALTPGIQRNYTKSI